jgi:polyphosphate kinase
MAMKSGIRELIERETALAAKTGRGRIIAKMNSLADPDVIRDLYRASQAGVKIDLILRGICCLRPGVPGVSENIKVTSIVDRFLEHHRIWFFENGGKQDVWLSSADWMSRNFDRRVEVAFPIEDTTAKARIVDEILGTVLADNVKARALQPDGSYVRVQPGSFGTGSAPFRSQERFMALARRTAAASQEPAHAGNAAGQESFPVAGGHRRSEKRRKKRL